MEQNSNDPQISATRRRVRDLNRAARRRHERMTDTYTVDDENDVADVILEMQQDYDEVAQDLDTALTALALVKLYYEDAASELGFPHSQSVKLRGYLMAEELLTRYGVSMLETLLGGDR